MFCYVFGRKLHNKIKLDHNTFCGWCLAMTSQKIFLVTSLELKKETFKIVFIQTWTLLKLHAKRLCSSFTSKASLKVYIKSFSECLLRSFFYSKCSRHSQTLPSTTSLFIKVSSIHTTTKSTIYSSLSEKYFMNFSAFKA